MKDTRAKGIQEFFERVAADWDTMRLAYYVERVIERMAAVSGADETMTVADVGTGTGFVATDVAPRVRRAHCGQLPGDPRRRPVTQSATNLRHQKPGCRENLQLIALIGS